jgi:AraC-like DNA-binding protein
MKVSNLPQDALAGEPIAGAGIIFRPFTATKKTLKEKAILDRNAISLVLKGQKTMCFPEKTVHANAQEIHFLSAGHCVASIDIPDREEFRSILIFFEDQELTDFFRANARAIEKAATLHKTTPSAYVAFKKDPFIEHYIESIQLMIRNGGEPSLPMKRLKLQELLLYLLENHSREFLAFKNRVPLSPAELSIRTVVEANLLSNLSVEEMAFLCNLSTSTFKRQFKNIYSESPNGWILGQKMRLAAQMLTQQKEKPAEIWFKLGFETHSGFTKSFKKHFGCAPKDYSSRLIVQD